MDTALSETMKADKISSETIKTGNVTAVVAVMSIFKKKDANCGALILEMRGLLTNRPKELLFRRKIPMDQEAFLKN
jgi:hypothetical protein